MVLSTTDREEHVQHLPTDMVGPEPSQEEEPALALPVDCISVHRPVELAVQVHPQVPVGTRPHP